MAIAFGSTHTIRAYSWTEFKAIIAIKNFSVQYDDDNIVYTIYGYDSQEVNTCTIWKGTVPSGVISGGYSQAQNDADKSDFETNYKPMSNYPVSIGNFNDPRIIYRTGFATLTSASEVTLVNRFYTEQNSEAQRSVQSTSANDKYPSGSGAKIVRLTYLDSNYNLFTEDIQLNGTSKVNTVGTNIRFIESMRIISGTAAAGAIKLMDGTTGGANEITGIGVGSDDTYLCHHYVPAGYSGSILKWQGITDDDVVFKLKYQERIDGNLVDHVPDTDRLTGLTAGSRLEFVRDIRGGLNYSEKTYIRVTVAPSQATTTNVRGFLYLWENKT